MSELQKCCQCLSHFNIQKIPRKLPYCSHSVCQKCIDELINTKAQILICGFCESTLKAKFFGELESNIGLLLKLPLAQQKNDVILDFKSQNDDLILTETEPFTSSEQHCQLHNKPNDLICISDKIKICSHCALFGTHKHHHFIRLEDFTTQIAHKHSKMKDLKQKISKIPIKTFSNIEQFINLNLNIKKQHLKIQIQRQFQKLILQIIQKKTKIINQLQEVYESLFNICKDNQQYQIYEVKIRQFQKFQEQLRIKLKKLNKNSLSLPEKIECFYASDFDTKFSDDRIIIDINNHYEDYRGKIKQILNDVVIQHNEEFISQFDIIKISNKNKKDNAVKSPNDSFSNLSIYSMRKSSSKQHTQAGTQKQIKKSIIQTQNNLNRFKTPNKKVKSPSHYDENKNTNFMTQSTIQLKKSGSPRQFNDLKIKMTESQIPKSKSPIKQSKSLLKQGQKLTQTIKKQNTQKTQTIYIEFSKNKLTDTFDISDCDLSSDVIVQYVHRARRMHKIRTLKIANNYLNPYGFQKMIQYLQGVTFINLVNNRLDESVIDIIFRCRHNLQSVKIINISNNPIHLDNKRMMKLQEIKKDGIVIIL